jgi:hypothetical protein
LVTPANAYFEGFHNTGSCAQKRVDVVTFLTKYSSGKNAAAVALPVNSMMVSTHKTTTFAVAPLMPSSAFKATNKSSAAILQINSKPIAANTMINVPNNKSEFPMSNKIPTTSPFEHIAFRRQDGTRVNIKSKARTTSVVRLLKNYLKLRREGAYINPVTMNKATELVDGIVKAAGMKPSASVPAVDNLRRPLTPDEFNALVAVADSNMRQMILVALYTGRRCGGVARLVSRDVELGTLHIRVTFTKACESELKPIV